MTITRWGAAMMADSNDEAMRGCVHSNFERMIQIFGFRGGWLEFFVFNFLLELFFSL
jgi:hypothetical protein